MNMEIINDTDTTPAEPALTVASPRRGRKALESTTVEPFPEIAPEVVQHLTEIREGTVSIREEDFARSVRIAEDMGKVKMAEAMRAGLELSVIRWFAEMKEDKNYTNVPIQRPDKTIFFPQTFTELCEGMGFSYAKINDDLQNYAQFGELCLSKARDLGLKTRDMRRLRAALKDAGEEEKADVFAALEETAPDALQGALDVICARNAKLVEENAQLKQDIEAKNKLAVERNKKLDDLDTKLLKATSTAPDDVAARLSVKNVNAAKQLDDACNSALGAILKVCNTAKVILHDEELDTDTRATVHKRVSLLCGSMATAILDGGIDVDLRVEFEPEWMRDTDGNADTEISTVM